ncbi:DUF819 family protein [Neolewinella lacunae]|uniref:DUF819 family protein n=1 Tax=Neolewinella lacunae TaxID=1517758 RepID=A0A923PMQ3_9BACT|nr:DUF819 family protein [Neolewinella lacunae]MBC6996299.1 DUF819 family protein [Neolewinella lacunae]MDN3636922.1 DUF819 family protein [Neolewinella lacunae]
MQPVFTNDAIVFGLLMVVLALIFTTSHSERPFWKRFYTYVPALLLCYFVPALLHWPLGLIAYDWYTPGLDAALAESGLSVPPGSSYGEINKLLETGGYNPKDFAAYKGHSQLYFMASRYLLPASLILLCLNIDLKGIFQLGYRAVVMFLAATVSIVLGGPIALLIITNLFPNLIGLDPEQLWRGLSTIAGSWIGGGANQAAMKEIFDVPTGIFGQMIIVDVLVANIWMGFLLFGAGRSERIDRWLKADNSAIKALTEKVENYAAQVKRSPTTVSTFQMLGVAFGGVALAHWGADQLAPFFAQYAEALERMRLTTLTSDFFWLVVIATTVGFLFSFTPARSLEGVGASRWGSVCIYILVATIGMQMNIGDIFSNLGLFAIGVIWMIIHVVILLFVAWLIKAPFFYVAVGSQANVGGAASAPVVASAFSPALAPVGAIMAVIGYALGTYGALVCAYLMEFAVSG